MYDNDITKIYKCLILIIEYYQYRTVKLDFEITRINL